MKSKNLPPLLSIAALLLIASTTSPAEQYGPQEFVHDDGTTDLGDGTTIASSDGTASVVD
ncbi:MAG: hypothetical protein GWO24_23675, partial [Akkermansiaceae bacterium]|nr:hypothetical protein [Akkermansiaceae bacterium]